MRPKILIQINELIFEFDSEVAPIYSIKEVDELRVSVYSDSLDNEPDIYFEDYQAQVESILDEEKIVFRTPRSRYFAECFGHAVVRLHLQDQTIPIVFNVLAKKSSSEQAIKMITYLASRHEQLIKVCFSRSSIPVGTAEGNFSDPETIISSAEDFIATLQNLRSELLATKRERLMPTRQPLWRANRLSYEIDPFDILLNLDSISPSPYESDLFLKGRHYKLDNIDVSTLQQTADVLENQILLGGLYSIQAKIKTVVDSLDPRQAPPPPIDGYESFERLLLKLTSVGMLKRCSEIQSITTELIRLFESRMGVRYKGELRPIMTPYARTSRVYRALYGKLVAWYALGLPTLGGVHFLMKLQSLSKIYELFTLFHIIENLISSDWLIKEAKAHPEFGEYVPSEVVLQKSELKATLSYEMKVYPLSDVTQDSELIDVWHRGRNFQHYNHWNPDFVLRLDSGGGDTRYIILDAKYSTEFTVRERHLPDLVEKYYWGMSVYDKALHAATNNSITCVLAIYPLAAQEKFIRYGKRAGIEQAICPLPIMGGVGLAIDNSDKFTNAIQTIIEKTISSIR